MRKTQTHIEQINANQKFRDIYNHLNSVMYLHLIPQLVRHSEAFGGRKLPGDPFGRGFLELLAATPPKTRQSRLTKIEKALKAAIPQLNHLTYTTDEKGVPHLESVYQHWRPHGARQREDQFSDGTLRLIALLWTFLEGDSLLLLEEPELSLNAEIVKKIPSLIHQLQRSKKKKQERQVILTTHSSDLLSSREIGGEEVLLLNPDSEGTTVRLASGVDEIRRLLESGQSIADAALPHINPQSVEQLDWLDQLFNQ